MTTPKPLHGIKVLDLTRFLAGPYCSMMLGDLGADVLKIEPPGGGDPTRLQGPPFVDGQGLTFLATNRNKSSLVLDLKSADDFAKLEALIEQADVLVENFRPDVMPKLGLGYDAVRALNPRIVYASISGFGATGPRAKEGAFDLTIQALGGYMSITGEPDAPPVKLGTSAFDMIAGMNACNGILTALFQRERTGCGEKIETSLLEGQIAFLSNAGIESLLGLGNPLKWGSEHPQLVPYKAFRSQDGWIVIGAGVQNLFEKLLAALERTELLEDPRFATLTGRLANREYVNAAIEAETSKHCTTWLASVLTECGVPCSPVRTVEEALDDPQVHAREMIVELRNGEGGATRTLGSPVKFGSFDITRGWSAAPGFNAGGEACAARWLAASSGTTQEESK
jgi:crotonobetainyl-CoA:carnitine CoA-transferase CaiB-like acyl-CoA transferase